MEIWKPLVRFGNLIEVSNLGSVRRVESVVKFGRGTRKIPSRVLKSRGHPWGYKWYEFSLNNKVYRDFGHRLVMEAFVGPCPKGHYVLHGDNNPANNALENLRYGTPTENCADKLIHGTQPSGEDIWCAKLSKAEIVRMRERRASGEKLETLSADYKIAESRVWKITTGRIWKNAPGPITDQKTVIKRLSDEDKKLVLEDRKLGMSISKLADKYKVSRNQIHRIVR